MMGRKSIAMIGLTFGSLTVLSEADASTPKNKIFRVRCSACDAEKEMLGGNIRRASRAGWAGCKCSSKATKHGLWKHPAYKTWEGMIARCYNPRHEAFHRYGGRGIKVSAEWRETPEAFVAWAEQNGFDAKLQLDRIDNDKGYSSSNCRFATLKQNANNRSTNRHLEINGSQLTIAEAARQFGIRKTTIRERLNRGWSDTDAVKPVGGEL